MKTTHDVIATAHRRLGVLATDEAATADMDQFARDTLDGVWAELQSIQGTGFAWDLETVPNEAFLPLSFLLATEISPHYDIPPRDNRAAMIGRLRALALPNDIKDRRDIDDDGAISEDEEYLGREAAFY